MGEQALTSAEMLSDLPPPVIPDALALATKSGIIEAAPGSPLARAVQRRVYEVNNNIVVNAGHDSVLFSIGGVPE